MENEDDKFKEILIQEINSNECINIINIMSIIGDMIRENDDGMIDPIVYVCVLALFDSAKKKKT